MASRQFEKAISILKMLFLEINEVTSLSIYEIESDLGSQAMFLLLRAIRESQGVEAMYPFIRAMEASSYSSQDAVDYVLEVI